MRKFSPPFKRNAGFTLVELAIAATLSAILATVGLYYQAQEMRYDLAHAQVDQLKVLGTALAKYEAQYANSLNSGTDVPGVANDWAPTVSELKALNLLDGNFQPTSLYGNGTYATKIRKSPTTCTGNSCSLFGLAYLTTPLVDDKNRVDSAALGEAIAYGGGDIGVSNPTNMANVSGSGGMWVEPSPLPTVAGILAIRISGSGGAYVPLDGSQSMTGSLKMGGNDVTNVNNVTASGNVSGYNVTASNQVSGSNVTASNTVSGSNVTASNTVSGYNVAASNQVSGTNVTASNTVSGYNVNGTNFNGTYITGSNINGTNSVTGNSMSTNSLWASNASTNNLTTSSATVNGNAVVGNTLYALNALIGNGGTSGNLASHSNWWPLILRDGWGNDNAQAQTSPGSAYVNDIYIRSAGKWGSQLGSNGIRTVVRYNSVNGYRFATATVQCASWETVVGGGGFCSQSEGFDWMNGSQPYYNGWLVSCDGGMKNDTNTGQVWAICAY